MRDPLPWHGRPIRHKTGSLREALARIAYLPPHAVKAYATCGHSSLIKHVARWRLEQGPKFAELCGLFQIAYAKSSADYGA